jgi:predicted NAD/FAD-dependent oxidoreductase
MALADHAMTEPSEDILWDVVIVGGGMAGLTAAQRLAAAGKRCLILEKSRGFGGRASLRRNDSWVADLGAQFVSHGGPVWNRLLAHHEPHLIRTTLGEPTGLRTVWAHHFGMNALVKGLVAVNNSMVTTQLASKVVRLDFENPTGHWRIGCDNGMSAKAQHLLLTCPLPQALDLVNASDLQADPTALETLKQTTMTSTIALVFRCVQKPWPLTANTPLWLELGQSIAGLFDQEGKGLERSDNTVVMHLPNDLTQDLWAASDADTAQKAWSVWSELARAHDQVLPPWDPQRIVWIHRWRYAQCLAPMAETCRTLCLANPQGHRAQLVLAGDAFAAGHGPQGLERAHASGLAAADTILSIAN